MAAPGWALLLQHQHVAAAGYTRCTLHTLRTALSGPCRRRAPPQQSYNSHALYSVALPLPYSVSDRITTKPKLFCYFPFSRLTMRGLTFHLVSAQARRNDKSELSNPFSVLEVIGLPRYQYDSSDRCLHEEVMDRENIDVSFTGDALFRLLDWPRAYSLCSVYHNAPELVFVRGRRHSLTLVS